MHEIQREHRELSKDEVAVLVKRYQAGDKDAGLVLLRSQGPWLTRRMKAFPPEHREDLLSEASILILEALERYDPKLGSLTNLIAHVLDRRLGRIINKLKGGGDLSQLTIENIEPDTKVDDREEIEMVREVMGRVLDPVSLHLVEAYFCGITISEISHRISTANNRPCSRSQASSVIQRSLRLVQDELIARGVDITSTFHKHSKLF